MGVENQFTIAVIYKQKKIADGRMVESIKYVVSLTQIGKISAMKMFMEL